ncbi:MAG: phage holin family protein [Actinomycetota bacterium]|nr:phage holin family protein [Actinomycetota bacterium]
MADTRHSEVDVTELREQSSLELLRSIATDSATLVRKEMELARQEIVEAVNARIKAALAAATAGVLGLMALGFFALAAAAALDNVMRPWASRLVVAGVFSVLAIAALAFGAMRAKHPPLAPEETKRTVKEDVEWAKTQLKR